MSVPSSDLALLAPSPASECVPPLEPKGVGNIRLQVRGGGANSDDWRGSLTFCLLCGSQYFKLNMEFMKLSIVYMGGLIASKESDTMTVLGSLCHKHTETPSVTSGNLRILRYTVRSLLSSGRFLLYFLNKQSELSQSVQLL